MKKFIVCFLVAFLLVGSLCVCFAEESIPQELTTYLNKYYSNYSYFVVKDNSSGIYYAYYAPRGQLKIRTNHYVDCYHFVSCNNGHVIDTGGNHLHSFKFAGTISTVILTHNLPFYTVTYLYYDRIKLAILDILKIVLPVLIIYISIRKGFSFVRSNIIGA